MNIALKKSLAGWGAVLILVALGACSDVSEEISSPSVQNEEASVLLRIPAFNMETTAKVTSAELYQFSDGVFVKKMTIDPSRENTVEFPRKLKTRIFAVAAHSLQGKERQSESDFSAMTIPMPADSHSAPVFFSSVTEIQEGAGIVDIELRRAVARLDIANSDPDLKIEKVSVSGAASSSQIFPMDGRTCECACANYTREFESGIEGVAERAFILFETSTPITVIVSGRRDGEAVEITAETPPIVRNTLYTVNIEKGRSDTSKNRMNENEADFGDDDAHKTTVRVADWQEGDVAMGSYDPGESAIDVMNSYIPSGVKINTAESTVTIPAEGVSGMMLAFSTVSPLALGSVIAETDGVRVIPIGSKETEGGYLSIFRFDIARQPKCASKYQATVFFHGSSDFFINLDVDPSPYQIPTVRIGGHDWMCFNAVSQDPEEQIFLSKGMTVEKMYTDRFMECIGNFFQQGRPDPFSPWKAYDPNQKEGQYRDTPWATGSMMPLPKGFHVPSSKEWEELIPSGTVIPSTYTTPSGETIRASFYTFPGTLDGTPSGATNGQKYLKRCILLESLDTGAILSLPMAGIKANTCVEIPTAPGFRFDTRSGYWMKEHEKVMMLDYSLLCDGREGIRMARNYWDEDGFVMLRGVRD